VSLPDRSEPLASETLPSIQYGYPEIAEIENPALTVPGALEAFRQVGVSAKHAGIPEATLAMVTLRASQINGCSVCLSTTQLR
jgi:alkylhydroperoxidase family enzyme